MENTDPSQTTGYLLIEEPKGKYKWLHETNLYSNPIFLFLVAKIFFFIWLGLAIFILLVSVPGSYDALEAFKSVGSTMLYMLLLLMVLITISYYFYALVMRGKYRVLFEMDDKGIRHTQVSDQSKKASRLGTITAIAGIAVGNPTVAGAGMLSATGQSLYTNFKRVQSIKENRRKHIIKLRSSLLIHNQVYTAPEDFDFVLSFIKEHVRTARE
ncbi:MAG: hypothetical protein GX850_06055 [Clostridiaceae bacterium]|jgi:hypothetical protein|nr:hypothetical protein [Clostridiaceae bacterium]